MASLLGGDIWLVWFGRILDVFCFKGKQTMTNTITFEYWPVDENTPREESIWMNWPEFGWIRNSYYSCMGFYTWNYYSGHPGTRWIKENQPTHWTHAIPAPGGEQQTTKEGLSK